METHLPMVWIGISELVYGLSVYFFMFLMRSKFDFIYYFIHIILPELIYTVAVTLIMYRPIRWYNDWLEKLDVDNTAEYTALSGTPAPPENKTEEL